MTPLQLAIVNNNTEIAGILLQHGHDPNFPSKDCDIPLIEAIKYNRPAIGETLCKECLYYELVLAPSPPTIFFFLLFNFTAKQLLSNHHCQVEVHRDIFGRLKPSPLHEALFTFQRFVMFNNLCGVFTYLVSPLLILLCFCWFTFHATFKLFKFSHIFYQIWKSRL